MICIIALPVLAIMGLFSASHRELAKEAFDCVVSTATLRPCKANFDQKVKGKIVGKLLTYSPSAARLVHQNFTLLSWLFVALSVLSMLGSLWGVYNYLAYGNCNGQNSPEGCILSATGLYHPSEFNRSGNETGPFYYTPCNETNYTSWRAANGSGG